MAVDATPPGGPGSAARADLLRALRAGPFPAALDLAIEAGGLSLEEIRAYLVERGVPVSTTTLSYWRRGRRRPERPESLRAVRLVEELLGLPADALVGLLGPRRARGRWVGRSSGVVEAGRLFDGDQAGLMLDRIGVPPRGALSRLSTHVLVGVDAQRRVTGVRMREILRANADRVAHCGVLYLADEDPASPPALTDTRYCRTGRVSVDRTAGLIACELILDRMLMAGEPAYIEYSWSFPEPLLMLSYEYRFLQQVREYLLQVQFTAGAVPARCHRHERRTVGAPEEIGRELWIGASNTALLVEHDVPPGIVGMRWEWPDS
ncbi:hypothetical protein GCM10010123_40470 [Pilimelia anulata]|uniref:Uncharacterized protein n=1 Tax=Pilimelia anulata TaxID=53371 RepID=A0A8J3BIP6_9ACTN|nr:hypothetical protein [Pilimelia anulata]GGK06548.1 hypothetical protein GCM10010123_40470 [Pilimelia anulata]